MITAKDLSYKNLFSCVSFRFREYLIIDLDSEGYIGDPDFDITGSEGPEETSRKVDPQSAFQAWVEVGEACCEEHKTETITMFIHNNVATRVIDY